MLVVMVTAFLEPYQLYATPDLHQSVRTAGIKHVVDHPENFAESITHDSFSSYIENMSKYGTWCDNVIIQAVANHFGCQIFIIETALNFSDVTIIVPSNLDSCQQNLYIGHLEEVHYVSTRWNDDISHISKHGPSTPLHHMNRKRKHTAKNSTRNQHAKASHSKSGLVVNNSKAALIQRWNSFSSNKSKSCDPKHTLETHQVAINWTLVEYFKTSIQSGPVYVCTCCSQLWFRTSVVACIQTSYRNCDERIIKLCLTDFQSSCDTAWICITCHKSLLHGEIPTFSVANMGEFPMKPDCLNLTSLEERLSSPRIPFMQLRELPRGGQVAIYGNVVNVPADVSQSVHKLPRLLSESHTIPVKLK